MRILAFVSILALAACQGTDYDTAKRTGVGAGIGAAGGAIIGAVTGRPGTGAAAGAILGGVLGGGYDQIQKGEDAKRAAPLAEDDSPLFEGR